MMPAGMRTVFDSRPFAINPFRIVHKEKYLLHTRCGNRSCACVATARTASEMARQTMMMMVHVQASGFERDEDWLRAS